MECRGIPIDQMTPFNYQSEQWKETKQIMIDPTISHEELTIKRTYIGYVNKNGKGMEKQCVLIKIYGYKYEDLDEEERKRYEKSVKVSKKLKEIDLANEHFVKLIDYGTADKSNPIGESAKWVTISELGERELKDEFEKVGQLSTEEIKTMLKDIMKSLVKFHKVGIHLHFTPRNLIVFERMVKVKSKQKALFARKMVKTLKLTNFDAPVLYLDGQKKGIVKENFSDYPFDFTAPELLENLSYGGQGDVEVTPKMDIWSAGLIILQFALKKTFGYKEMDKKIWQLFRSAKLKFEGGKFKPDPKKLDLPEQIYECQKYLKYDEYWPSKNWWDDYLTVITDILTVWDKMPEIVFLSVNMLNIDAQKRMSAQGVIDYLEGKCKPKEYEKNTKKIALFGDVSAEKLEKFMGKNHMGFSVFRKYLNDDGRIKNKDALEKLENIKQNLIKNALISIETFLKELDKRAEFCDH
ncbi:hypothetical protein niasHT_020145 [Heterodera trifolii]|uniref:Protein kinase domain-containing protein n=1 Tax=Heterodera trifolii TaxID=157864 RepID=A0ABD2KIF0_9BILA